MKRHPRNINLSFPHLLLLLQHPLPFLHRLLLFLLLPLPLLQTAVAEAEYSRVEVLDLCLEAL